MSHRFDQRKSFQVPKSNRFLIRVIFGTVIATLFILAILPFTQALSGDPRDRSIREVAVANIPPPEPPPPEPPPPPEEEEEEPPPEYEAPPPPLSLSQLDAAMNPGVGEGFGSGFELSNFQLQADSRDEILIFELRDLDRAPRPLKRIAPVWPSDVNRERITGIVRAKILIDDTGKARVLEILETPDSRMNKAVRDAIAEWRFEVPTKDGKPVNAQYIQPIEKQ